MEWTLSWSLNSSYSGEEVHNSLRVLFGVSNVICIESIEEVLNKNLESFWFCTETSWIKNFTCSSEELGTDVTVLETVQENILIRELGAENLFNPIINGNWFLEGTIEVNMDFHVLMKLHKHVNELRWTSKFTEKDPESAPINNIKGFCFFV